MSMMGGGDLGTLTFRISGDASGATSAAAQANQALGSLEGAVAQNWWGIRNLAFAFTALPAAVAAGVGASISAASQLETAMVSVGRTTGLAGDQLESVTNQLMDIGKIRAVPTLEILGIAESAGALGIASDDIVAFTQTVSDLVQTTDLGASDASTGLARLAALTGTTAGGFDNLASSIFGTGVETAATEKDILALSQRLAGVGAGFGLSAQEIVGWSAAVLSAGVKTQEGATQISKTLIDIQRAVSQNGTDLQGWAAIAGQSADQFKASFDQSANQGLLSIVEGLGNIISTGGDFVAYLDNVGVKEQRQVKTLLLLAQAQAQSANENLKASNILQVANKYFADTERLEKAVADKANTLAGQMQILKNNVFTASAAFGSTFAGAGGSVIRVINTMLSGIVAMNPVVRGLAAGIIGLATVASGLAAVLLLVGPRVLIAWDAMKRLQTAGAPAAQALTGVSTAQTEVAQTGTQLLASIDANNQALARQEAAALRAAEGIAAEIGPLVTAKDVMADYNRTAGLTITTNTGVSNTLSRIGLAAKISTGLMIGLAVYTYALGRAEQRLQEQTANAQKANDDLTNIMRTQQAAIGASSNEWLAHNSTYQSVVASAQRLGIAEGDVQAIVNSTAGGTQWAEMLKTIDGAQGDSKDSANELIRNLYNLRQQWKNSVGDAGVAAGSMEGLGKATNDLSEDAAMADAEYNKLRKTLEAQAQAANDLITAELGARKADLDLHDAEVALQRAQEDAARAAEKQAAAEINLQEAQRSAEKAARDVADAEVKLGRARAEAAQAVIDANNRLLDAQDSYYKSLDTIEKTEEALAELRKGPAAKEFIDATNKLADAQLKLRHATLDVRDLEENLAYLRQNGAGARDIEEAELALADANQNVADSTADVTDAQQALNDLSDPVKRAQAIAKAERDVAAARRDAASILTEIRKDEQDLADARTAQANDTAYKDAELALLDAQAAQADAADKIIAAQRALEDLRNGSSTADAQQAEIDYEQALYNTAAAHVEVIKQTTLLSGATWDAGQQARAMADELGKLNVITGDAITQRAAWIAELSKAPVVPPESQGSGFGGGGGAGDGGLGDVGPVPGSDGVTLPDSAIEHAKTSFMDALAGIAATGGGFMVAQLGASVAKSLKNKIFGSAGEEAGKVLASTVADTAGTGLVEAGATTIGPAMAEGVGGGMATAGVLMPAIIAALPYIIVALLIAGLIALLIKDGNWEKVWNAIVDGLSAAASWVSDHWQEILLAVLLGPFGILMDLLGISGGDIMNGLWDGIKAGFEFIKKWFFDMPVSILTFIGNAELWLIEKGGNILSGLLSGIVGFAQNIWNFFTNLPFQLWNILVNAGTWLISTGGTILGGLRDGFVTGFTVITDWFVSLPGKLWDSVKDAGSWLFKTGQNIIIGLVNGIASLVRHIPFVGNSIADDMINAVNAVLKVESPSKVFHEIGRNVGLGLILGIQSTQGEVARAAASLADSAVVSADFLAQTGLDGFAGGTAALSMALSPAGAPVTPTVVNNYNEHIETNVESPADPEDIVNGYLFAHRVQRRG